MKNRQTVYNLIATYFLQFITIGSALIIPRMIILNYGSEVNGLITSLTQFLAYIAIIDAGGGVVRAALYGPLHRKDIKSYSRIYITSKIFFRKIGIVFIAYLFFISFVFAFFSSTSESWTYVFSLSLIIGISFIIEYFFSINMMLFLQADGKIWVTSIIQTLSLIIITLVTVIMINYGISLLIVKLCASIGIMIRPFLYRLYIKRNYVIHTQLKSDNSLIEQRWHAMGHHIANIVHSNTDVFIITIFFGFYDVSVYSVYLIIVKALTNLVNVFMNTMIPLLGKTFKSVDLKNIFAKYEFINNVLVSSLFVVMLLQMNKFILLYIDGEESSLYTRETFGLIFALAYALYSFRAPYLGLILSKGLFKETKISAYLEATINLTSSVILVIIFGFIGVAIGTFISMSYRTVYLIKYCGKKVTKTKYLLSIIQLVLNMVLILITYSLFNFLFIEYDLSITNWVLNSILYFATAVVFFFVSNYLFIYIIKDKLEGVYK